MKKNELRSIIEELLNSYLGIKRTVAGWHIDEINSSLSHEKQWWYSKALEYFLASFLVACQLKLPWHVKLLLYLKGKKRATGINFSSPKDLLKEFLDAPPEIIASLEELSDKNVSKQNLDFIPPYFDGCLRETYDSRDHLFDRVFLMSIHKRWTLRLMVARSIRRFSLKMLDLDWVRLIDKKRFNLLQNLLIKEPTNILYLVEFGALLLLAYNDINQAIDVFKKVLKFDSKNIDARFWLATIYYYCFDHVKQAENYIKEVLKIAPCDARALSFMYLISWRTTKSMANGVHYLEKAIKNEPSWILPRIQLALFYLYDKQGDQACKVLLNIKNINVRKSAHIIDLYNAHYVSGNIRDNIVVMHEIFSMSKVFPQKITKDEISFLNNLVSKFPA